MADGGPYLFPGPVLRRMSAEQAWDSCATLVVGKEVDKFHAHRGATYAEVMKVNLGEGMTPESLKADNVLTVALCQHPAGLSSGFLSLAIIGNDSNDPTDLGATINLKSTAASLGDAWTQFPESFRKTIEED
jgi:hypothetical protein